MKVAMVNVRDAGGGGATKAIQRLRAGLVRQGLECPMIVQLRSGESSDAIGPRTQRFPGKMAALRQTLDGLPLHGYRSREKRLFSLQWLPDGLAGQIRRLSPDLVVLESIAEGFVRIETLRKINRPLVWNIPDSWAFTGGCHFPSECTRYRDACGRCPMLGSSRERDLSRWVWRRKSRAWKALDLTVVAPSRWMADCAHASSLLGGCRIEVIPNALDTEVFRPMEAAAARGLLRLDSDKKIVLFGAPRALSDRNKGFDLLDGALQRLVESDGWRGQFMLVTFGANPVSGAGSSRYEVRHLGVLQDELTLAAAYAAADVMVVPSRRESFGQTASEALSCGTPVVAFDSTGLKDIVDHRRSGYLARPYDLSDLAEGLIWVLADPTRRKVLGAEGRTKAARFFALDVVARQYVRLLRDLVHSGDAGLG